MPIAFGTVAALAAAGFTAGLFDSVVGGGGVVTLPTLLWTGLSPYMALGTNKLAGTFASSTSSLNFARSGRVHPRLLALMFPFTFVGAILGANTVLGINERYLRVTILAVILLIAAFTALKRDLGQHDAFPGLTPRVVAMAVPSAFGLGFYDGFIGPGTGSFLLFLFLLLFQFDFVIAAGNGRVLNFASNVGALLLFAWRGKVDLVLGLTMGAAMMAGAMTGSRLAIQKGTPWIRPLFLVVALALAIQVAYSIVF